MPSSDRRPCTSCAKPTKMKGGRCQQCLGPQGKRPERPCQECGKRTTAKSGKCRECATPSWAKVQPVEYAHAVYAETPGRWVRRGLIQVWEPARPPESQAA